MDELYPGKNSLSILPGKNDISAWQPNKKLGGSGHAVRWSEMLGPGLGEL
jgi:hypothetical protein